MSIEINVPAKINLWLEVIRKRSDGYHDLSSLMLPIRVFDHLELVLRADNEISLECKCPGVPENEENLVWKAAKLCLKAVGAKAGIHIRVQKNIPIGAGLGGGSADAAATLLGINAITGNPLSNVQLHNLARELGADVPFFLCSRPALAEGIGEQLKYIEGVPSYPILLVKPPITVSTAWAYQSLKLTRGNSRINLKKFLQHPWALHEILANDLETVTIPELPVIQQIKHWLIEQGAAGALMSGSGPTVFGIFEDLDRAKNAGQFAAAVWKDCWTMMCESVGAEVSRN